MIDRREFILALGATGLLTACQSGPPKPSVITVNVAGGRSAKLWELYQKRHREIAISAEQTFLGEIGADFRNAYEEE